MGLFIILAYLEEWNFWFLRFNANRGPSPLDLNQYPDFFSSSGVPEIFKDYVRRHNEMIENPLLPSSKFVYYEIPGEAESLAEALLGLTSAFLFGLLSGRGLLVQWTDAWLTPLAPGANATHAARRSSLGELLVDPTFGWPSRGRTAPAPRSC